MSIESLAIALHHTRSTGSTKLVLIGIANHDGDGGAWPSVATLARYACVTPRHVIRCVRKLEALGEIETVVGGGGGRSDEDHTRPNLYRFLLRCPAGCDGTTQHRQRPPVTPRSGGDTQVIPPPDLDVTPPLTPVTLKPSINRPSNRQPVAGGDGKGARAPRERLSFANEFGIEWSVALQKLVDENRACAILKRVGVDDAGQAKRILGEWAASVDRKSAKGESVTDAAGLLARIADRFQEGLGSSTAAGEASTPSWV